MLVARHDDDDGDWISGLRKLRYWGSAGGYWHTAIEEINPHLAQMEYLSFYIKKMSKNSQMATW